MSGRPLRQSAVSRRSKKFKSNLTSDSLPLAQSFLSEFVNNVRIRIVKEVDEKVNFGA